MVQRYYVGSSGLVKTDNVKDGKWVAYSDYATLAAAAKRLVEVVRPDGLRNGIMTHNEYPVALLVKYSGDDCRRIVAALAEVEALLKEG